MIGQPHFVKSHLDGIGVDITQDVVGSMFEAGETLQQTPECTLLLADGQPSAFCRPFRLYIPFQNVSVEDDQPRPKFAMVTSSHVGQIRDEVGAIEPVKITVTEKRDLALDPCMLVCLVERIGWLPDYIGHLTIFNHPLNLACSGGEKMWDHTGDPALFLFLSKGSLFVRPWNAADDVAQVGVASVPLVAAYRHGSGAGSAFRLSRSWSMAKMSALRAGGTILADFAKTSIA